MSAAYCFFGLMTGTKDLMSLCLKPDAVILAHPKMHTVPYGAFLYTCSIIQ